MPVPVFRPSAIDPRLLLNEQVPANVLADSHMLRASRSTLQFLEANGHIGLTKSGAFNRKFIGWAVEDIQWPGFTPEDLYKLNKVLNEIDVLPLEVLHDLLCNGRIIRHSGGKALITKLGRSLLDCEGRIQSILFETFFMRFDFSAFERWPSRIDDLDPLHCFGIIQQRCDDWMELPVFAGYCLPIPYLLHKNIATEEDARFHVYARLVRPLSWLGLLQVQRPSRSASLTKMKVRGSPLFQQLISFDFDGVSGQQH